MRTSGIEVTVFDRQVLELDLKAAVGSPRVGGHFIELDCRSFADSLQNKRIIFKVKELAHELAFSCWTAATPCWSAKLVHARRLNLFHYQGRWVNCRPRLSALSESKQVQIIERERVLGESRSIAFLLDNVSPYGILQNILDCHWWQIDHRNGDIRSHIMDEELSEPRSG